MTPYDDLGDSERDPEAGHLDPYTALVYQMRALHRRLSWLERIVYGACAMILVAVIGVWIKSSLK